MSEGETPPGTPVAAAGGGDRVLPMRDRVLWGLALYATSMTLYYAAGNLAHRPLTCVSTRLDDLIPFHPDAMAGYALVYVVPLSLLAIETTADGVARMFRAVVLAYVLAFPFFALMPVQDADPAFTPHDFLGRLLAMNRQADTTKNAFPSMHVGLATLLAFIAARRSRAWAWLLGGSALAISVSTLLVKQHFLVDLPAGAMIAALAYRAVYGDWPLRRGAR